MVCLLLCGAGRKLGEQNGYNKCHHKETKWLLAVLNKRKGVNKNEGTMDRDCIT